MGNNNLQTLHFLKKNCKKLRIPSLYEKLRRASLWDFDQIALGYVPFQIQALYI
jgi:hypothetical protein